MSCRATSCAYLLSFCLLLLAVPSLSEIHRARSIQTFKHRFRSADTDSKPEISEWTKWFEDKVWGHPRRVWVYSSISAGLVGLTGLFPLFVIPVSCGAGLKSKASRGRLQLLLSFAVGGLLGDVFLHLLPEAWVHVDAKSGNLPGYRNIGGWVLTGLLSFYVIERLFGGKDDEDNEEEEEEEEKEKEEEKEEDKMDDKMKTEEDVDGLSGKEETASTSSDDSCNGDITRGFAWKIRKERSGQSNCIKRIKSKKIKKRGVENLSQVDAEHVAAKPSLTSLLSPPPASLKQNYDSSTQLIPAQDNKDHIKVSGWLNLLANVVDNFTHGLAVAGSYSISSKMGLLTTLAILLHEIPHEIGDFAILLQAGFDRWRAAKVQVLTATGGIIGAMMALSAESAKILGDSTAWILPFTAGGFINIALIAIVPELLKESNARNSMKQLLLMCSGIFVMGLVTALVD